MREMFKLLPSTHYQGCGIHAKSSIYPRPMWMKPAALVLDKEKLSSGFHTTDLIRSIRESGISCHMFCWIKAKLKLLITNMREMFKHLPGTYYQGCAIQARSSINQRPMWLKPAALVLDKEKFSSVFHSTDLI